MLTMTRSVCCVSLFLKYNCHLYLFINYRTVNPVGGGGGGGGGGYSDIFIQTQAWVQNSEFQYFWGFSEKLIFLGGMKILWIFFGVITKLGWVEGLFYAI